MDINNILEEYENSKTKKYSNEINNCKKVIVNVNNEDKNIFFKNNKLIQTKYDLTSFENKLYLFMSNLMRKNYNNDQIKTQTITFDRRSLRPLSSSYENIQVKKMTSIFSKLRKKTIYIREINDDGKECWGEYGFINSYRYIPEDDTFEVDMNVKVTGLIIEHYMGGYTPVNLNVIYNLKSIYAQRFYELLRLQSWKGHKINYKVNDLKEFLQVDNKKSYELYGNFKRKIIMPAINELNESGSFRISFEEKRTHKKITSIDFYVEDLEGRTYFKKRLKEDDYFVPDLDIFTKGTLKLFKLDFKDIDFENIEYQELFNEAVAVAIDKDNVSIIDTNTYKYFKPVLINKIKDYELNMGKINAYDVF